MGKTTAQAGDTCILYSGYENIKAVKLTPGKITASKVGQFYHDDIISRPYGSVIRDRKHPLKWTCALAWTAELNTLSLSHRTQILYHHDIASAMMMMDVQPGKRIVESGTGSASMSCCLARTLRPGGKLFTFEFHKARYEDAKTEFESYGLLDVVVPHRRNVYESGFIPVDKYLNNKINFENENEDFGPGIDLCSVDSVFLDLPSPWLAAEHADAILKPHGKIVVFCPCVEQVQQVEQKLDSLGYQALRTIEVLLKPWGVWTQTSSKFRGEKIARSILHNKDFKPKKRKFAKFKDGDKNSESEGDELQKVENESEEKTALELNNNNNLKINKNKNNDSEFEMEDSGIIKKKDIIFGISSKAFYCLNMRGHTGYLLMAVKPPADEKTLFC